MKKYYDLCRGEFKEGILMTKELCAKYVADNEWEDLLNAPREKRLEKKILWDFGGLGDDASVQQLKSLIDFELAELGKYHEIKDSKKL